MKTQFRRILCLIILAIFALTILGFSILIALRGNLQSAALTLACSALFWCLLLPSLLTKSARSQEP